jgi:putative ABC transport system permease protein
MNEPAAPPRFAERLLERLLPNNARSEAILGDLAEEMAAMARRHSRAFVLAWYVVESLRLSFRFRMQRPSGDRRRMTRKGDGSMETFLRDVKLAFRALSGAPAYTAIVAATLALGIGANTAIFSVVDALILRPFPIPEVDRLVMLWESVPKLDEDRGPVSPANFLDWQEQTTTLADVVALEWWDVNLSGKGEPERLQGTFVSPRYLEVLGVEPYLGRTLAADRDSYGAKTVVLSYQLFSRRFGADPDIVGQTIRLDGEAYQVVGVAREGFDYPNGTEVWAPLWFDAETAKLRDRHYLDVIGKLETGVSVQDARAELDVIADRLAEEYPSANAGRGIRAVSLATAVVDLGTPTFLAVWQTTTVFVLLIACVNVANLLLARGADRQKELSLQQALGAGRARLVRQLLTENLLLAMAGAALSLPLAWVGIRLIRGGLPAEIQRFVVGWRQIGLDPRVLAFTAIVTVLTTFVFGLFPALRASRADLTGALKEGGRGGTETAGKQRGRGLLVILEVALALMLLVASGLSIRGTLRLTHGDQGYDPERLMTFQITLPERDYDDDAKRLQFSRSLLEGVRGIPAVKSADLSNVIPSSGSNTSRPIDVEGRTIENASERPLADFRSVSVGYFETMRIPLRAGRGFSSADRADGELVAIVSETFAARHFAGEAPIGRRFRAGSDDEPFRTVVGVVGDVVQDWFFGGPRPTYYLPLEQQARTSMVLVARTEGDPEAITAAVRTEVRRVDPDLPLFNVRTMRKVINDRLIGVRYAAVIMGILGVIALVLAAVGIYGLMAYSVSRRRHEIGVRVALGASHRDVLRLTVGQVLRVTIAGVLIGLLLAYGAGQLMASNLFGVIRLDVVTFAGLASILTLVSIVAGYMPARRALSVDPALALRSE